MPLAEFPLAPMASQPPDEAPLDDFDIVLPRRNVTVPSIIFGRDIGVSLALQKLPLNKRPHPEAPPQAASKDAEARRR
jgi:hypothetical protein